MASRAQSAIEWLMTHSWAVIVILLVGLTLNHLGFFEASARPRFEGLNAAGIQPMPAEVQLYSDGVLILTVRNTRPYTMRYDWVDIAPIGDPSDVIRTYLGNLLKQGDVGSYEINGTNLAGGSGASFQLLTDSSGKTTYTDFHITQQETHLIPGRDPETKTLNGKAWQITTYSTPHGGGGGVGGGGGGGPTGCQRHRACTCSEPQGLTCQSCHDGYWDNYEGCYDGEGAWPTEVCWNNIQPTGSCILASEIPCSVDSDCPLTSCQKCVGGTCDNQVNCPGGGYCVWTDGLPFGSCWI